MTIGETVSLALDRRARAWHAEGKFFDEPLPVLRTRIRQTYPVLAELERSTESVDVAKSRIGKSNDPDVRKAVELLDSWA